MKLELQPVGLAELDAEAGRLRSRLPQDWPGFDLEAAKRTLSPTAYEALIESDEFMAWEMHMAARELVSR